MQQRANCLLSSIILWGSTRRFQSRKVSQVGHLELKGSFTFRLFLLCAAVTSRTPEATLEREETVSGARFLGSVKSGTNVREINFDFHGSRAAPSRGTHETRLLDERSLEGCRSRVPRKPEKTRPRQLRPSDLSQL